MERRAFLLASCAVGASITQRVRGQSVERPRHIGILFPAAPSMGIPKEFVDQIRQRGWVIGENFLLERRVAANESELPALAKELVQLKVDLIITNGTPAARAAKEATKTIPVLIQVGTDPVQQGLVSSISRPGGNLTGFEWGLHDEKLLEVLKEAVPNIRRVMYPMAPSAASMRTAKALGITLLSVPIPDEGHLDDLYAAVRKQRPDGVVVPNVTWMNFRGEVLGRAMAELSVPAVSMSLSFVRAGGLLAYAPEEDMARIAAKIDALLRGEPPATTPIEGPTRFRTAINLATAKKLRLNVPDHFMVRITDAIE